MNNMLKTISHLSLTGFISLTILFSPLYAAEKKPDKYRFEDTEAFMRLVIRTPEQLIAFYEGRQFKREAINKILHTCFIPPIVKNKKFDVMWLELDNWEFRDPHNRSIKRIKRSYWKKQWQAVKLSQAHQSTFGWTLMPEVRDLRQDEGVGGSIAIPWQNIPFTLIARFKTGADKKGPEKIIRFHGVVCKKDNSTD